jgi:hypothetical protein
VVFCVHPDHREDAAAYWRALGFEFSAIELPGSGLRVLLDWEGGIEIVSPTVEAGSDCEAVRRFLREQGEGVLTVVIRTGEVGGPRSMAAEFGGRADYEQHREGEGYWLDEVMLSPVHGMPVTLLATDLAD